MTSSTPRSKVTLLWPKWRDLGKDMLDQQKTIVSVKMIGWTQKSISILLSIPNIQATNKNTEINVPLSILKNPLFYCFQIVANN